MCISKEDFIKKYNMCNISCDDGFFIDLKYASIDNFTGIALYSTNNCLLRKGTFEKLVKARDILRQHGYYIKIWDAYRSISVQTKLFSVVKDERYVSNPKKSTSNHCKGSAVDITLCDKKGNDIKMPTNFDHFGAESCRAYYNKLDELTKNNVILLENAMVKAGFIPFENEWWHFNDSDEYDIIYEEYK